MIAAFDLDGTLIKNNCSFAFCRFLQQKFYFKRSHLFFCAFQYFRHKYLGLSLRDLHVLIFQRLFQGKRVSILEPFVHQFLDEVIDTFWYQPALDRLRSMQKEGIRCLVLSSSPLFLVEPIARKLGITEVFATRYQTDYEDKLSSLSLLMDGFQKAKIISSLKSNKTHIVAFSDSLLDLPFLKRAGSAVAVNPKRALRNLAIREKWEIL